MSNEFRSERDRKFGLPLGFRLDDQGHVYCLQCRKRWRVPEKMHLLSANAAQLLDEHLVVLHPSPYPSEPSWTHWS
jgi:hypothetical protein